MLNLLFISNSPKIQPIQEIMQPLIKAKIDVVSDFDHGLKDVFEKRPATVIIQEQISGVTGESVARHIQLLLGNGAPKFVLLHEGNTKIKPIPGLFEHVIDLNQPGRTLVAEILSALKQICGVEWEKVAIDRPPSIPAAQSPVRTVQKEREAPVPVIESAQSGEPPEEPDFFASAPGGETGEDVRGKQVVPKRVSPPVDALPVPVSGAKTELPPEPVKTVQVPKPAVGAQPTPSVKDFTISGSATVNAEMIPEDILRTFDENCRTRSRKSALVIAVVVLGVIAGGAYLFRDQPRLRSLYHVVMPSTKPAEPKPGQTGKVAASAQPHVPPAPQRVMSSVSKSAAVSLPPLPSFVSVNSRDRTYSTRKPGWERYVDAQRDVRIFRQSDRIKALQVVAAPGQAITEEFLKTALNEVTGSSTVSPGSHQQKRGYLVQRSRVGQHADLLVYRSIGSKAIIGFVVSLD
ncbi:MAG: hypothetical protein HXX11_04840 [Desulfuromonadales bacterium]|nr:hypothetical protein [Desulfuromonadales bacterium]